MATRLHRIGTIFTRVDGAYRKGLIKESNLPLWFNVYKRFPPKYEPQYTTDYKKVKVREIFYEEDILRAEIHKICRNNQEVIDLINESDESQSQKLIKTCQQYISEGMTKEDALKKIKDLVDSNPKSLKNYKKIVQDVKDIIPPAKTPT